MYRPNRIGPWPLYDFDDVSNTWPSAWNTAGNFNLADTAQGAMAPAVRSATVRDDYDQVTWDSTQDITLAANSVMSFGVAINGSAENDRGLHYGVSGSIVCATSAQAFGGIAIGRCDNASLSVDYGANANSCAKWFVLPRDRDWETP